MNPSAVVPPSAQTMAGNLIRGLRSEIANARQADQQQVTETRAREAARLHQQREHAAWVKQRLAERVPLAVQGVLHLVAVVQSPEIQDLLRLRGEATGFFSLIFYSASRPSGAAWEQGPKYGSGTRDVAIYLNSHSIAYEFGSVAANDMSRRKLVLKAGSIPSEDKVQAFLDAITSPNWHDLRIVSNSRQRMQEWFPDVAAFQVFVNCAEKKKLRYLLRRALTR